MPAFHPTFYADPPGPRPLKPPARFISSRRAETGGTIRLILAGDLDLAARRHLESDLDEAQGAPRSGTGGSGGHMSERTTIGPRLPIGPDDRPAQGALR